MVNLVTVTGTFTDGGGNALSGNVTFTPSDDLTDVADSAFYVASPVQVSLDGDGEFSIELIATDNANLAPEGWTWAAAVSIGWSAPNSGANPGPGIATSSFPFLLPSSPSTVDITDLMPAGFSILGDGYTGGVILSPAIGYLPLSGGTETGTVILEGSPAARVPGATTGQVLVSDAFGNLTPQAVSGTSAVSSVFGRTGPVAATSGDYTVSQVTGAAPLASPALTGSPTAPTQTTGDTSTKIATDAFVATAAAALLPLAGGTMSGAIAMGSHKVTGLTNGSASSDAAAYGQTPGGGATVTVAQGGTGDTSLTAYAPLAGGITTTGVLQQCTTGLSTSGYVLTSTGSTSLPTFQAPSGGSGSASVLTASYGTTSQALAANTYGAFLITMTGNPTFSAFNGATGGTECSFTLYLKQDSTGSRTITAWPSSVKWQDAIAPTLTTTALATDIFVFSSPDGGTTWYGALAGANY